MDPTQNNDAENLFQTQLRDISKHDISSTGWNAMCGEVLRELPKPQLHRFRRWRQQQLVYENILGQISTDPPQEVSIGYVISKIQEELWKC